MVVVNTESENEKHLWRDPDVLEHLYWEREMSLREIADELGCHFSTVQKWAHRLEIELRPPNSEKTHPTVWTSSEGYTYYSARVGEQMKHVSQHELIALLAGYPPEEVFDGDTHVHHELRLPSSFDVSQLDIMGNLIVMDSAEHLRGHQTDAHEEPEIEDILDD